MKVTYSSYTIPSQKVEIAVVVMPNGMKYYVNAENVHPGNFPETATELNSISMLKDYLMDLMDLLSDIGSKRDWDRENTWGGRKYNPCLKPWDDIISDTKLSKRKLVELAKRIRDNGGWSKYNDPEEAERFFKRILFLSYGGYKGMLSYINRERVLAILNNNN